MAEMQGQPPQQSSELTADDLNIKAMMAMLSPKEFMQVAQGLQTMLKNKAMLTPPPDPLEQFMNPGPMEQLAVMDLERRKRAHAQGSMGNQATPRQG